jgi:hypothetical protein
MNQMKNINNDQLAAIAGGTIPLIRPEYPLVGPYLLAKAIVIIVRLFKSH